MTVRISILQSRQVKQKTHWRTYQPWLSSPSPAVVFLPEHDTRGPVLEWSWN